MSMAATITLSQSGHQALPAELDPNGEGLEYGFTLPYAADGLDEIAHGLGVRPLSDFFDDSEMLSEEEYEEAGIAPKQVAWFSSDEGLRTLDALSAEVEKRGPSSTVGSGGRPDPVADVLWDLNASRLILQRARASGERFKYTIG